jgi:hypothetical protein
MWLVWLFWRGGRSVVDNSSHCADCAVPCGLEDEMKTNMNTLPSDHVNSRACYPVCSWQVTNFLFFLHDALHMRLSVGQAHLSREAYRHLDAECLGAKLETNSLVMTPYFWNHNIATNGPLILIHSLFSFHCNHGLVLKCSARGHHFVWVICGYTFWL